MVFVLALFLAFLLKPAFKRCFPRRFLFLQHSRHDRVL